MGRRLECGALDARKKEVKRLVETHMAATEARKAAAAAEACDEDEDDAATATKKTKKAMTQKAAPSENEEEDDARLVKLRLLARAMRVGPSIYKGLANVGDDDAKVAALGERLKAKGASFTGEAPSTHDIAAAQRKSDRAAELDGIDPSLILSSKRARRQTEKPPPPPPRTKQDDSEASSDDEESENDDDDDDDHDDDAGGGGGDDEAEFV